MTTQELRKVLLENASKMLAYAVSELNGASTKFRFEYERGFVYGWSSYCISFSYFPKTKKAEIAINWYRGREYAISSDGTSCKVFDGHKDTDEYITHIYLNNTMWGDAQHIQQALEITQNKWSSIKSAIARHIEKEQEILNFQV